VRATESTLRIAHLRSAAQIQAMKKSAAILFLGLLCSWGLAAEPVPQYTYRATVVKVKDGDTISADIDLGFKTWLHGVPLRLARVNAPETFRPKDAAEREAGLKIKAFVESRLPVGKRITITTKKDSQEKYGRYLAEVWADGRNVNDEILALMK